MLICDASVFAQQNSGENVKDLKDKVDRIDQRIQKEAQKVSDVRKKEADILDELDDIDKKLNMAEKNVRINRSEFKNLELKLKQTNDEYDQLLTRIEAREAYVSTRLISLYKLQWLGKMNLLASAESVTDFLRRKFMIETILEDDHQQLKWLMEDREKLQKIQTMLQIQRDKAQELAITHQNQVRTISSQKIKRTELLGKMRNEKSLLMASISSLKKAARELDQKIEALQTPIKTVKPDPGKKVKPESSVRHVVRKSKNSVDKPFPSFKGFLKIPVEGKIIHRFGKHKDSELNIPRFRSGIDIKSDKGSPIRSVAAGKILYARWFKGYGNMIIIDHGDSYYTVYAHAEEIFKSEGDTVEMDEVIATVGDTGSIMGAGLHFEVRHNGKPVDPMKWLKKS